MHWWGRRAWGHKLRVLKNLIRRDFEILRGTTLPVTIVGPGDQLREGKMAEMTGGCLCGQVRYTANADPVFVGVRDGPGGRQRFAAADVAVPPIRAT